MAKTIACALVGARLDYANSVLVGVKTKHVARLQRAQNAVARVVSLGTNRQSTNSSALLNRAAAGMGIPMGIPMGMGMVWVWGL